MAMVIMGADNAGIHGAQLFRVDDQPRYRRAFNVYIAILTFGLLLAGTRFLDDKLRRKKANNRSPGSGNESKWYSGGVIETAAPASGQCVSIALDEPIFSLSKVNS